MFANRARTLTIAVAVVGGMSTGGAATSAQGQVEQVAVHQDWTVFTPREPAGMLHRLAAHRLDRAPRQRDGRRWTVTTSGCS